MLLLYSREGDLMESMYIILIVAFVVALVLGLLTIKLMRSYQSKKLLDGVNNLEIRKNNLESLPVMVELSKIEDIAKSEQLEERLNDFKERYQEIKETKLTKINNMIVDMDIVVEKRKVKEYHDKYADIEIELEEANYSLNKILEEINEIASYEEKYRDIVTKLKGKYRFLEKTFKEKESLFGDIKDVVAMQFENIEKRFNDFDTVMEQKLFIEVVLVVKSLDTMIDHLDIILKELPDILLLLNDLIPGRINDLKTEYEQMVSDEYPLAYLHLEDNLASIEKRENDILDRAKVLNITDSLFDLRTILEYLDGLFKDLEKEKSARREFDINNEAFSNKVKKLEKLFKDIYSQLDDIKALYDLHEKDLEIIDEVNLKLSGVIKDYKHLLRDVKKCENSYLKVNITLNELSIRLNKVEEELDKALKTLGSMYDDEMRAREQLKDMRELLKKCKSNIRSHHLPIIHDNYFIEVSEAEEAIEEVVKELENKPIVIKTLNMRVDTARDLVFKLHATTNEMIKYAYLTETLVVYGNRYRHNQDIDRGLSKVEMLYYRGDYQDSFELVLKVLELKNPDITKKVLKICNN